jgi:nucleotide-binding universal stress UspA family protein
MKDIVLHLPPVPDYAVGPGARFALALAAAHEAHVTALIYSIDVAVPMTGPGFVPGAPVIPPLENDRSDAEATASAFAEAARVQGVPCETVIERNAAFGIGQSLADYARVRDMAVMDAEPRDSAGRRFLIEAALFDSGRPLLLVPKGTKGQTPQRAVVAWDASSSAARAVNDAMPFLKRCERVVVASVSDDKELRLDQSGIELTKHLARHGIAADFAAVSREGRSVGVALAQTATDHGAELLVMGGFAHSRLRGLVLGSATREIVNHGFAMPVLLSH